ncbi:tyrosine-type recombinase/integrase [uncultured Ligilactobacillus sp.]|uniref:tyrosine-type recombinase/integrase n=1 Tax=uncultured Ligilactobacillus sp. TaxID=2837633 RepID=UPI00258816A9|nr:tyrosine-type recombinase/integrase [uncultured Ligilactobacillus sp.]
MVFANSRGELLPSSNAVNKTLRKLMANCGLKKKNFHFHFHSLRHTHVAFLLYQVVDLYAISKRLGHSNMTITATRYAYLIDELREKEDEKISKVIGRLS